MSRYQYVDNVEIGSCEVYRTIDDLKDAIAENEISISRLRQKLFRYCCGNLKDLLVDDLGECNENLVDRMQYEFESIFDDEICGLRSLIETNLKLKYLLDNYDNSKIDE